VGRGAIRALAVTIICGAFPGTAAAWQELPAQGIGHAGVATCLRAAGDGELAVTGAVRRDATPMTLLAAGPSGFTGARSISLGVLEICPEVAAGPGGDLVLAGFNNTGAGPGTSDGGTVRAVSRIPGQTADIVTDVASTDGYVDEIAAAVDQQGHAVVAWAESGDAARLRAALRQPDGTWGDAFDVVPPKETDQPDDRLIAVAPDGSGGFAMSWADQSVPVAIVKAGGAKVFIASLRGSGAGPVTKLGQTDFIAALEMRSTPDGRILLAYDGSGKVHLQEHAPGSAGFTPLAPLALKGRTLYAPALDLAADGSALVAAGVSSAPLFSSADRFKFGISAWLRHGERPFGAEQTLQPLKLVTPRSFIFDSSGYGGAGAAPPADDGSGIRAALAPDGQALVTWNWPARTRDGDRPSGTYAALGTLDGGFAARQRLGSLCRAGTGVTPLLTNIGPITAWADNLTHAGGDSEQPSGHGLVHLALPAGVAGDTPAPRARLQIKPQALKYAQALKTKASCDRACDLRAFVVDRQGREIALGSGSLAHRGTIPLAVRTVSNDYHVSGGRSGRVRVRLHACSPGSTSMSSTTATAHIRAVSPRPAPRLGGLTARREGHAIVVEWTVTSGSPNADFDVELHGPGLDGFSPYEDIERTAPRHFVMRIDPPFRHRVRSVTVTVRSKAAPHRSRSYSVRVT
jgi:hypothetical protein